MWSLKWDEFHKILRDPILLSTIILVAISLLIFIVWPLYDVLKESFLDGKGSLTLEYYFEALSHQENIDVLINTVVLGLFVSFFPQPSALSSHTSTPT